MSEWLSCRPNLEVADLGPPTAFLRDVLGFTVEAHEEAMGLVLLSRDAVGLAMVRAEVEAANRVYSSVEEYASWLSQRRPLVAGRRKERRFT